MLVTAWAVLDIWAWRRRSSLWALGALKLTGLFLLPAGFGIALIAWSVYNDEGMWWLLGAATLAAVQILAAVLVERSSDHRQITTP